MTIFEFLLVWILPAVGLAVFIAGAWLNAVMLFGWAKWVRDRREEGGHVSVMPFMAGVIGAISMWNGPFDWMRGFFWLPLLLDVGCGPYIVMILLSLAKGDSETQRFAQADAATRIAERAEQAKLRFPSLAGCIVGTAVGDALGLPYEGLSRRRRARLYPEMDRYHLLPFGRGMCSDDTEHTIMVAQALIETAQYGKTNRDTEYFRSKLASGMRFWLLGLPAGIGMATLKSILKLWLFLPQRWQGTFSAGNAPSMRSALIGVFWAEEPELLRMHVRAATRLTHSDPKAEYAALAVAFAAAESARNEGRIDALEYARRLRTFLGTEGAELAALIDRVALSVQAGEKTLTFAQGMGLETGVTGYAFHTVPVALHAWLAHSGNYREAVLAAIECGGDTDTIAAITGAIAGAGTGLDGLPLEWLRRLAEWPHTVQWMEQLAQTLAEVRTNYIWGEAPTASALKVGARNLFFLAVVLIHGFRRMLPPY